jgi:hypothetical protein
MMPVQKRKMKLMADYQCWCLWDMNDPRNVNPDALPISEELKKILHSWEEVFDQTLDLVDNTNIGFKDENSYNSFYDTGWALLALLRFELPSIEWWYRDRRFDHLLNSKPPIGKLV